MKVTVVCLLALAVGTAGFAADEVGTVDGAVVVRRFVAVPEPVMGPSSGGKDGGQPRCAGHGPRERRKADEIRSWLAPRMARRDEPGLSLVLRLDDAQRGTFYILFHEEKVYSELRYPPEPSKLRTSMAEQWAKAGVDPFETRIDSPLRSTAVTLHGLAATEHRLGTASSRGTNELTMQVLSDPALGDVAFRLETLRSAIGSGRLTNLWHEAGVSGIVLGRRSVSRWLDNPPNEMVERLVSFERRPLPLDTFAVPAGYSKVRFSPDCFVGLPKPAAPR